VEWTRVINVKWFCFEVEWVTLKFLGTKVTCTLGWPYIEGTSLCFDYFIWCVSCIVVVLNCFVTCKCAYVWVCVCLGFVVCECVGFVMCGFCNVWVFWQLCGCFGKMCTCIYSIFVLFHLCFSYCARRLPPATCPATFHVWKTRGYQCSFRLMIMGDVLPETCWASNKYHV
jgi:hypothetical protein